MTFEATYGSFEDHTQWKTVKEVCRTLKEAGYQALLAGGCVRDLLMKRTPNDFDIATDATPDQVEGLFPKSITVGKAFGVTILPFDGYQIEVATFREDLEYKDGRRPEGVKFSTPQADASRRDFTVNALFFDPETNQVIDFVNGQKDIEAKVLRTVGEPKRRFNEDKLRILRAIRFAAQLDFEIESGTLASVIELATEVSVVSRERVRDELLKLLKSSERVKGLSLLLSTGVLSTAFPETAPFILEDEDAWLKRFLEARAIESDGTVALEFDEVFWLSLFVFPAFEGSGEKDFRDRQLKTLKIENQTADQVVFALKNLNFVTDPSGQRKGELIQLLTKPAAPAMLKLALVLEKTGEIAPSPERLALLADAQRAGRSADGKPVSPFVNGQDLKKLGVKPGPKMGELLHEAYLRQLEGALQHREAALAWIKSEISED
jgi:poly(A) polymerase